MSADVPRETDAAKQDIVNLDPTTVAVSELWTNSESSPHAPREVLESTTHAPREVLGLQIDEPSPLVERLDKLEQAIGTLTQYVRPAAPSEQSRSAFTAEAPRVELPPIPPLSEPPGVAAPYRRAWYSVPFLSDMKLIGQMYLDPRYQISSTVKLGVPGIIAALVLNYLFFSMVFTLYFFSPVFERLILIVLVLILYKILAREIVRYQSVLDYLGKYGR